MTDKDVMRLRSELRALQQYATDASTAMAMAESQYALPGEFTSNLAKFRDGLARLYREGYLSDRILPLMNGAELAHDLWANFYEDSDELWRRSKLLADMTHKYDPLLPRGLFPQAPWTAVRNWVWGYLPDALIDISAAVNDKPEPRTVQ